MTEASPPVVEPFVASLIRRAKDAKPDLTKVLDAKDWDDATRQAKAWAREQLTGGVVSNTWLHLEQGGVGRFLDEWTFP